MYMLNDKKIDKQYTSSRTLNLNRPAVFILRFFLFYPCKDTEAANELRNYGEIPNEGRENFDDNLRE